MLREKQDSQMSYLIDEYLLVLKAEGYSPSTIRDRGRCLRRLHQDLPHGILYACREQLQAWLAYERWSRWTRATYSGHVLAFYPWLLARGYLEDDPTSGMKRPRSPVGVPRPATDQQIAIAMQAPEPLLTAVLLARYQGMRRAEIAACHREHIAEEMTLIPVAKGGDAQTVPTHPVVWEHVRRRPDGPLVTDRHGLELGPAKLSAVAMRWFRRHGMPGFGLHQLRHRFGTDIQRQYRDIRVTQECLRHRSIASTQLYTAVTDNQRCAAVRLVGETGPDSARPGLTDRA